MNRIEPTVPRWPDTRFAVISTQWNPAVVDALVEGARRTLLDAGVPDGNIDHAVVPGAWEIPLMAEYLAAQGRYAGIITLGAVIKGETAHFEYVAGECARELAALSRAHRIPVGFGVLATYTLEQALDRAGPNDENKGIEAANAVLDMVRLMRSLDGG